MSTPPKSKLFPVFILSHRVVMTPLTRLRSEQPGDIPGDLVAKMYGQRASGRRLIIVEATTVSVLDRGHLGALDLHVG
jgi:N-ethylmaleimide reductase